eukprot:jgi/Psemu1/16227/gm1.16227_g
MENGVNDDGRPLPSTPDTTGLAWNEAISFFVHTGDLSPVTAGMFLSLAAKGDNTTSSNDSVLPDQALLIQRHPDIQKCSVFSLCEEQKKKLHCDHELQSSSGLLLARKQLSFLPPTNSTAPHDKEQRSPPKACPSVGVGKSIDPPKSKTKNRLKPRRPNFNWKTAQSITFENLEIAGAFITTNYPLLCKRSSKPNAHYLPKGTTHEYQCFVAKAQQGFCRAHLEERIGQCLALKVNIVGDCACSGDETRNGRGVSPQDVLVLNSVMKDNSKLEPKAMVGEVKALVQEESPSVSSPELRSMLASKLKNKIKHQFIRKQMLGTRSLNPEDNLKQWGSSLFDKEYLRPMPKEDGSRSYRPFLLILCPSEKEMYFTAGLSVPVHFIDGLFGVSDFNFQGGIVTDHTKVFVTPCMVAFPFSVNLQCFPHIHRKFLIGKGNGDYSTHSMDKKWFQGSTASDVQSLYQCISNPMFDTLAKLTKESWLARGEKRLVELEGASKFDGLCAIGKNIGSMLTEELLKAIYMMSLQRTSLCCTFPILNRNQIFNKKSNFYMKLSRYCSLVDKQIDIRTITEGTPMQYLNSKDSLGKMTGTNMHNATKCLINNSVKKSFMRSLANNPAISTLVVKLNVWQRNQSFVDKHISLAKEALKHSCDIADVATQMVSNPSSTLCVESLDRAIC